jgi:hypothetical protein
MADVVTSFFGGLNKSQPSSSGSDSTVNSFFSTLKPVVTSPKPIKNEIPEVQAPSGGFQIGDFVNSVESGFNSIVKSIQNKFTELSNGSKVSLTSPSESFQSASENFKQNAIPAGIQEIPDFSPTQKQLTPGQMSKLQPDFGGSVAGASAQLKPGATDKVNELTQKAAAILSTNILDPWMEAIPQIKKPLTAFLEKAANTPVGGLPFITPKTMMNLKLPGEDALSKLPDAIKESIPLVQVPSQIQAMSRFLGNLASLNPSIGNLIMLLVPEVTTITGKALLKNFGNDAISFLANKDLLYKVTSDTASAEEISQFKLLNETGLTKEAARSPGGISVTNTVPKQGQMWDLLRKIFPDGFNTEGAMTPELPKMIEGKIDLMHDQLVTGEYAPQQVIDNLVNNNLTKTADGEALMKTAIDAQKQGMNVKIESANKLNIKGLDETTNTKIEELNQKDISNPVEEDKVRVYQAISPNNTTDWAFKTPEQLAQFKNNVTAPEEEFKMVDVLPEQIQQAEGKPEGVYRILPLSEVKPVTLEQHQVSVPREQLPIGEGKQRVSKLAEDMAKSLQNAPKEIQDLLGSATYKQMNNKDTIQKAAEYVIQNQEEAMRVLKGEIEPPKGLNTNSIYVAMANEGLGNFELANKLASLKSTAMGQNIEILKELNPDSPIVIASKIYKLKEKLLAKRYAGKTVEQVKAPLIKKGKSAIKAPKLSDWNEIIKKVLC